MLNHNLISWGIKLTNKELLQIIYNDKLLEIGMATNEVKLDKLRTWWWDCQIKDIVNENNLIKIYLGRPNKFIKKLDDKSANYLKELQNKLHELYGITLELHKADPNKVDLLFFEVEDLNRL